MKNYRSLLILSAFFISETIFGQFTLTGKVVDSASREPLYGASVFCQNTTSGTITNKEGGFSLQLKAGGYELIISFTGYQTREIRISNNDNSPLQIELVKEEKTMGEVVIRSSNEVTDGWNKYGKFFLENFIGSTPNSVLCTLQNPEVLHFYYYKKSDKLKVLATEPVLISNKINIWREIEADSAGYVENDDLAGTTALLKRWVAIEPRVQMAMKENAKDCFVRRFEIERATDSLLEVLHR